jgi:hypothetical protein
MKLIASDVFICWQSFLETGGSNQAERAKSGGRSQESNLPGIAGDPNWI